MLSLSVNHIARQMKYNVNHLFIVKIEKMPVHNVHQRCWYYGKIIRKNTTSKPDPLQEILLSKCAVCNHITCGILPNHLFIVFKFFYNISFQFYHKM